MTNATQASGGKGSLGGSLVMLAVSLLATGFLTRSCHASSTWDNMNVFSPGFLKAGAVDETVTKYQAIAQGAQSRAQHCDAYTNIADAYSRLSYEESLAKAYRDKAADYCKLVATPAPVAPPGVGERQRMAKAVFTAVRARKSAGAALGEAPECREVTSKALGTLLPIVRLREHRDLPGAEQLLASRNSAADCLVCYPGSAYTESCNAAEKAVRSAIAEMDKTLPAPVRLGPKWLEI